MRSWELVFTGVKLNRDMRLAGGRYRYSAFHCLSKRGNPCHIKRFYKEPYGVAGSVDFINSQVDRGVPAVVNGVHDAAAGHAVADADADDDGPNRAEGQHARHGKRL